MCSAECWLRTNICSIYTARTPAVWQLEACHMHCYLLITEIILNNYSQTLKTPLVCNISKYDSGANCHQKVSLWLLCLGDLTFGIEYNRSIACRAIWIPAHEYMMMVYIIYSKYYVQIESQIWAPMRLRSSNCDCQKQRIILFLCINM